MEYPRIRQVGIIFGVTLAIAAGCSSGRSGGNLKPIETAESAPAIINPRVSAPVIQLSPDLNHAQTPNVMADIKDVNDKVSDVRLQISLVQPQNPGQNFLQAPYEVEMKNFGGTTWGATFTDEDLHRLAVNGQTMVYQGRIIARSESGASAESTQPIQFAVSAPAISG